MCRVHVRVRVRVRVRVHIRVRVRVRFHVCVRVRVRVRFHVCVRVRFKFVNIFLLINYDINYQGIRRVLVTAPPRRLCTLGPGSVYSKNCGPRSADPPRSGLDLLNLTTDRNPKIRLYNLELSRDIGMQAT